MMEIYIPHGVCFKSIGILPADSTLEDVHKFISSDRGLNYSECIQFCGLFSASHSTPIHHLLTHSLSNQKKIYYFTLPALFMPIHYDKDANSPTWLWQQLPLSDSFVRFLTHCYLSLLKIPHSQKNVIHVINFIYVLCHAMNLSVAKTVSVCLTHADLVTRLYVRFIKRKPPPPPPTAGVQLDKVLHSFCSTEFVRAIVRQFLSSLHLEAFQLSSNGSCLLLDLSPVPPSLSSSSSPPPSHPLQDSAASSFFPEVVDLSWSESMDSLTLKLNPYNSETLQHELALAGAGDRLQSLLFSVVLLIHHRSPYLLLNKHWVEKNAGMHQLHCDLPHARTHFGHHTSEVKSFSLKSLLTDDKFQSEEPRFTSVLFDWRPCFVNDEQRLVRTILSYSQYEATQKLPGHDEQWKMLESEYRHIKEDFQFRSIQRLRHHALLSIHGSLLECTGTLVEYFECHLLGVPREWNIHLSPPSLAKVIQSIAEAVDYLNNIVRVTHRDVCGCVVMTRHSANSICVKLMEGPGMLLRKLEKELTFRCQDNVDVAHLNALLKLLLLQNKSFQQQEEEEGWMNQLQDFHTRKLPAQHENVRVWLDDWMALCKTLFPEDSPTTFPALPFETDYMLRCRRSQESRLMAPYDNLTFSRTHYAKLGNGHYGCVYRGEWKSLYPMLSRDVAIKVCDPVKLEHFHNERNIHSQLVHEHVLELLRIDTGVLVLELAENDLLTHLRQPTPTTSLDQMISFSEQLLKRVKDWCLCHPLMVQAESQSFSDCNTDRAFNSCFSIFTIFFLEMKQFGHLLKLDQALIYISDDKHIFHGDIACRNCFLFPNSVLKLGDFGLAVKLEMDRNNAWKPNEERPIYWYPFHDAFITSQADMWSFGVCVWEIFSGGKNVRDEMCHLLNRSCAEKDSLKHLYNQEAKEKTRLPRPDVIQSSEFNCMWQVLMQCWHPKSDKRFQSFRELHQLWMKHLKFA